MRLIALIAAVLFLLPTLARAQTVTPLVYSAITIHETDAARVLGAETIHVYLERIQVGTATYHRLAMSYDRSTAPGVPRNYSSYTSGSYYSHVIRPYNGFQVTGRVGTNRLVLDVSKTGTVWSVQMKVLDAVGKVLYGRATGLNIKVMEINIQGVTGVMTATAMPETTPH